MGWGDDYLCLALYFDSLARSEWERPAWGALGSLAACLRCEPSHFDYDTRDKGGPKSCVKYIKRNIRRVMRDIEEKELTTIDLFHVGPDVDFIMSPFGGTAKNMLIEGENAGLLFIQIMANVVQGFDSSFGLCQKAIEILSGPFRCFYGLVHPLFGGKYPGLYFRQAAMSAHLSDAEKRNCDEWGATGQTRSRMIRGVYWGNLLGPGHWGGPAEKRERLARRLATECGARISRVGDLLFFCAPFDPIRQQTWARGKFELIRDESWERSMRQFRQSCRRVLAQEGVQMLKSPEE